MSNFLIGWGEQSLVPEKKVSLCGQFFERISEYVESEITATALAVEADNAQMILVSADLTSVSEDLMAAIREELKKICPTFDGQNLIVAATHTHTSHSLAKRSGGATFSSTQQLLEEFLPEGSGYKELVEPNSEVISPEDAFDFVAKRIALAAKEAWDAKAPAYYANEFGRAAVGMCRRVHYDDGSSQMWGDTNTANFDCLEGGNDSGVELLYLFDQAKKLTGVVANIACPAQILEQRSFISGDYWGAAKRLLREKLGGEIYLLGLCGAAGDQCPRDLVRWVEPETPIDDPNVKRPHPIERKADPSMYDIRGCHKVGKRIANEIVSVYEEIEELKDQAPFTHQVFRMDLPLRKATMKQYHHAIREIEYYVQKNSDKSEFNFEDVAKMHIHLGTIARFREQQNTELYPIESHIVRFGDIAIATNPFELFLDYGNRIKARSLAAQTFIVQLCCGKGGYLPTEKAELAGHYSAYISSGNVGHSGGDLYTRTTIEKINQLWK